MSTNIVEIKQNDSSSESNLPKAKIIPERNITNHKILYGKRKIMLISLIIFLISALFIFCSYLFLSQKSKASSYLQELNILNLQKKRSLKLIRVVQPGDLKTETENENESTIRCLNTNAEYVKNVLLVTNYISKNGNWQSKISPDVLYNILSQMNKINLTVLDPYDPTIDTKGINYLKSFHLVAIDFVDGGYNLSPRCPNFLKALIQYIKEGGALFTCHDQFDDTHSRFITQEALDMLQLLGLVHCNSHGEGGSIAYFDKTAISNSFFLINNVLDGDSIPIAYTHQTYSRYNESCTTCKVLMKFKANGANSYEYLVTNRPYKGKTLNIRSGHSTGFTEQEKKLFLSSILWLLYEL